MSKFLHDSHKKKVNIIAPHFPPIRVLSVPIRGNINGITITVKNIFDCICQKAIVDEVLHNGKTIRLDLSNYNVDHNKVVETATPPKEETAPEKEETVAEEVQDEKEVVTEDTVAETKEEEVAEETSKPAEVNTTSKEETTSEDGENQSPAEEEVPEEESTDTPKLTKRQQYLQQQKEKNKK